MIEPRRPASLLANSISALDGHGSILLNDRSHPRSTGVDSEEIIAAVHARRAQVRENRLRRMAERQGLRLVKSRRRDPRAIEYGTYMLVNAEINGVVAGTAGTGRPSFTLDDVENYLTRGGES